MRQLLSRQAGIFLVTLSSKRQKHTPKKKSGRVTSGFQQLQQNQAAVCVWTNAAASAVEAFQTDSCTRAACEKEQRDQGAEAEEECTYGAKRASFVRIRCRCTVHHILGVCFLSTGHCDDDVG